MFIQNIQEWIQFRIIWEMIMLTSSKLDFIITCPWLFYFFLITILTHIMQIFSFHRVFAGKQYASSNMCKLLHMRDMAYKLLDMKDM